MKSGLESFGKHLNPTIISQIKSWSQDPELSKLLKTLRSANNQQSFLDYYAEAVVARHFISLGCKLEVEVPTPCGRSVDLRVTKDNHSFNVHIKRLNLEERIQKELDVITRFRHLSKIPGSFNVEVNLSERLTDKEAQKVCKKVKDFIKIPGVGNKRNIKNSDGKTLAECKKIFPKSKGKGKNVGVYVLPKLWAPRDRKGLYKKLSEAYKQFMPKSLNVILVTSRLEAAFDDFEKSLLDSSGFWSNEKHPDSYMAGWFKFGNKDYITFRMCCRENYEVPIFITRLFGSVS